tara:strand:+ start:137 stop:790 length:654 start_codon:yes stop_codon:yes gene_type:complete
LALENHYKTRRHKDKLEKNIEKTEVFELKKQLEEEKHKVKQLTIENDKLRSQLSKKPATYNNSKHYENCTFNNIQLNLSINPHGCENWSYLRDEIFTIMKGVNTCIPEMVKKIHFDKNHPENHNIKFPNKKLSNMRTFNGEEWKTFHKKDVIESLIMNLVDKLEEEYGQDFRLKSTQFIQELWDRKTNPIISDQKIDKNLRRQVEYSIIDGQHELKN